MTTVPMDQDIIFREIYGRWKIDNYRTHVSVYQVASDAEVVLEVLRKEHDVALTCADAIYLFIQGILFFFEFYSSRCN